MADWNFTLRIDLGDDAMQTTLDVADALEQVAARLRSHGGWSADESAPIKDVNGNTVGSWSVVGDDADSPLGDPPTELADAWRRFQAGETVEPWEVRALDEWRADRAQEAGY